MDCQPYAKHRFRQKSERCFCISSGHRDQKRPAHFPRFVHGGSAGCIPHRALTGSPGCAIGGAATGDTSSRTAPFPWIGKGRGIGSNRFLALPHLDLPLRGDAVQKNQQQVFYHHDRVDGRTAIPLAVQVSRLFMHTR